MDVAFIFSPWRTLPASAVHPRGEDHEEAHPRGAPGPEEHVRGAHPEVLGRGHRPRESARFVSTSRPPPPRVRCVIVSSSPHSKLRGSLTTPTNVSRRSTTNSGSRRWVSRPDGEEIASVPQWQKNAFKSSSSSSSWFAANKQWT